MVEYVKATVSIDDHLSEISEVVLGKMFGWWENGLAMLPNAFVAVLVFALSMLLAGIARRISQRGVAKLTDNNLLPSLIGTAVKLTILVIGLMVILNILNLDRAVTSLLAGVGVAGIALGFAFQEIASNFISGVILAVKRPFKEDDLIEVKGIFGHNRGLSLRATRIETPTGQMVYIPNRDVLNDAIMNFSELGKRRIDVEVGVEYSADLDTVQATVIDALTSVEGKHPSMDVEVHLDNFGASSINLFARLWIEIPGPNFFDVRSNIVKAIVSHFRAADLSIPFPIRTLDVAGRLAVDTEDSNRRTA